MVTLRVGQKPTIEPYKTVTSVVASNRMEALYHLSLPNIGWIKHGRRLISKTVRQSPSFPKWWVVELEWQPLKLRWHNLGSIKVLRWVKTIAKRNNDV